MPRRGVFGPTRTPATRWATAPTRSVYRDGRHRELGLKPSGRHRLGTASCTTLARAREEILAVSAAHPLAGRRRSDRLPLAPVQCLGLIG